MQQISEIKGEKSFDVLAGIIEPVANIAADEKTASLFVARQIPDGMSLQEYVLQRVKEAVPQLMKCHKKDLITILALLSDMSVKEYKAQMTPDGLMLDMSKLISDPIFNAFFTMSQSRETPSASASENTEE